MKLSVPVYQLKRRARLMARAENVPLNVALDRIARTEGFARWDLLAKFVATPSRSEPLLARLENGELLLLAARSGQGKTRLGLQLLLDAASAGQKAVLFTLEFTQSQARQLMTAMADGNRAASDAVEVVTSDDICAGVIIEHLSGAAAGAVAVIDYLQLLDQRRTAPPLSEQVLALRNFAQQSGTVLVFLSQVDRSFEPEAGRLPGIGDIRLPNQLDLRLFSKACFLHAGETRLQAVA